MTSVKGAVRRGLGIALESYLAAIRLTQDQTTLGELEVQAEDDQRLCTSDRNFVRHLVEARIRTHA